MKTSQEWWAEVKADPAKFNDWLVKQYRGEVTAAVRIRAIATRFRVEPRIHCTLNTIAAQEQLHAQWVRELLIARGIQPDTDGAEERYWKAVKPAMVDFHATAAVGAHAEEMRLERIRVIVADEAAPPDVAAVFRRILPHEVWHASAFREMAGEVAMKDTQYTHELGRALLGLVH